MVLRLDGYQFDTAQLTTEIITFGRDEEETAGTVLET